MAEQVFEPSNKRRSAAEIRRARGARGQAASLLPSKGNAKGKSQFTLATGKPKPKVEPKAKPVKDRPLKWIPITVAAEMVGRHTQTLRRWDRSNLLVAKRDEHNQLVYSASQIEKMKLLVQRKTK